MNIRSIQRIELTGEQLAKVSAEDLKVLARANRALKAAHKSGDMLKFSAASRAFSELGIHFTVWA
jgi:DNA-binding GntR family transcriptional regulator